MTAAAPARPRRTRYRDDPSVLTVLRTPRLLTREALAGLVVALALIPEAISFSIIAGVDPRVGLFSSFVMAVSIAFLGGRPAMITAATGAVALVIAPVARSAGPPARRRSQAQGRLSALRASKASMAAPPPEMTVARRCGVHRCTSRAQFILTTLGTTTSRG